MKRGSRFHRKRCVAMALVALALVPGCVERTRIETEGPPLWERYESDDLSPAREDFVLRYLEIGGRVECSGDHFFEQTTEVFARARFKKTGDPAKVRQIFVEFRYLDGLMKDTKTSQRSYDGNQAVVEEKLRVDLNPGAVCSCVSVVGIMWIGKHNPAVGGIVCPEQP